jgi:hypothetical protein
MEFVADHNLLLHMKETGHQATGTNTNEKPNHRYPKIERRNV